VPDEDRQLGQAAKKAKSVLAENPNDEAAWNALANFYHAESKLAATMDYLTFAKASQWLPNCTNASPHFPAIQLRDSCRHGSDCLLDFHECIVVRLPRREVHLFTREQAIAFRPVNFEVARLNLVDLDAADVGSDT
jgi:hypothetical protein